jgi:hypothetical protein
MTDTPWIAFDTSALAKSGSKVEERDGVKVAMSLSPYDVPEAARGFKDEKHKKYVIEFKYIQDEPWETRKDREDSPLAMRIGKNSARLYGFEFDVPMLMKSNIRHADLIAKLITSSLEKLTQNPRTPSRRGHYTVLQQAVDEKEAQLLDDLDDEMRHAAAG